MDALFHRLQTHIAYRPSGLEVDGRHLFCLCGIPAASTRPKRSRQAKEQERHKKETATPKEESDSPITIHTYHSVIPAPIVPAPKAPTPEASLDPGEAEGTGRQPTKRGQPEQFPVIIALFASLR